MECGHRARAHAVLHPQRSRARSSGQTHPIAIGQDLQTLVEAYPYDAGYYLYSKKIEVDDGNTALVTIVSSSPRLLVLDHTRCYSGCGAEVCRDPLVGLDQVFRAVNLTLKRMVTSSNTQGTHSGLYRGNYYQLLYSVQHISLHSLKLCSYHFFGSNRSSRNANLRSSVRAFGSNLSRAVNLHHSGSNLQTISQE